LVNYLIIVVVSYLLGSIPSAYLIVRLVAGKDIRTQGSGNIGAMNSYDVTHKKWIGTVVFFCDALKGLSAVIFVKIVFHGTYPELALAGLCALAGHNFSIFLKFSGGRGLSTAVGIFVLLNPLMIVIWALFWLITYYFIYKNVHIANASATFALPIVTLFIPLFVINSTSLLAVGTSTEFILSVFLMSLIILIRHIKPIKKLS
jgi:acyl phosphate:glycerol-3-phosphate acyltransferase